MPNPRTGTITPKIGPAIKELKQCKISFKNDNFGNIHVVIGKASFDQAKLKENFDSFLKALRAVKPEKLKGSFIQALYLSSSMGPSVKVAL
mgnify:FL=1